MKTTPYIRYRTSLPKDGILVLKGRSGKERKIKPGKWWVNGNTPVGEDAELWEVKPYGGKKLIEWSKLLAIETEF